MKSNQNYLIIVVGPTAIGKTALSIELAQYFGCDIVSCDSRQFYKEMTIGTAVPSQEELATVPHHFIQNKSIKEDYSVGMYEAEVLPLLDRLFQKRNIQVLVGGSGLYVDAVLKGFDVFPEVSEQIKDDIEQKYQELGLKYLQDLLEKLDPYYFSHLKESNPQTLVNPQRMKRFVSVCIAANAPYSSFLNQKKHTRNFIPVLIGLEAERAVMYERINLRVDIMMQQGLFEEVKALQSQQSLNALQTVGYRELFSCLNGAISLDEAVEEIKKNTRRFAKRQLTWFKNNSDIRWFSFREPVQNILNYINEFTR